MSWCKSATGTQRVRVAAFFIQKLYEKIKNPHQHSDEGVTCRVVSPLGLPDEYAKVLTQSWQNALTCVVVGHCLSNSFFISEKFRLFIIPKRR